MRDSQSLLLKVNLRSTFRNKFLQPATHVFVARKFITQGEKRQTSTQNLQRNNVSRKVESFCISYFAEFIAIVHADSHATYVIYASIRALSI